MKKWYYAIKLIDGKEIYFSSTYMEKPAAQKHFEFKYPAKDFLMVGEFDDYLEMVREIKRKGVVIL